MFLLEAFVVVTLWEKHFVLRNTGGSRSNVCGVRVVFFSPFSFGARSDRRERENKVAATRGGTVKLYVTLATTKREIRKKKRGVRAFAQCNQQHRLCSKAGSEGRETPEKKKRKHKCSVTLVVQNQSFPVEDPTCVFFLYFVFVCFLLFTAL